MSVELMKRERECFEHLKAAERLGVSLKEYADGKRKNNHVVNYLAKNN